MKSSVRYKKESDILIRSFFGEVTMEDVVRSWKEIIEGELIDSKTKGIITDFWEAEFATTIKDIPILERFIKEHTSIFTSVRHAIVIDSPKVAVPLYFENNSFGIKLKPFSTINAARRWISE